MSNTPWTPARRAADWSKIRTRTFPALAVAGRPERCGADSAAGAPTHTGRPSARRAHALGAGTDTSAEPGLGQDAFAAGTPPVVP
ncbi:MAG TPA: hypothetical protein VFU43_03860 [Streptosporangiaceae bacterium]|nr:hypothetical protein [Streptosporangiaceae bacterium]